MTKTEVERLIEDARYLWEDGDAQIHIPAKPEVLPCQNGGAYIQAWLWVPPPPVVEGEDTGMIEECSCVACGGFEEGE